MPKQTNGSSSRRSVLAIALTGMPVWAMAQAPVNLDALRNPPKPGFVRVVRKHNHSGIDVQYKSPNRMSVGQVADMVLILEGAQTPGATAALKAPAGLAVLTPGPFDLAVGKPTTVTLKVKALANGLHYIVLQTSQGAQASVVTLPVQVGDGVAPLAQTGTLREAPGGEKVISMPGQ